MRHVALIAGPPCSGKTTLAHHLAGMRPGEVLDRDDIARQIDNSQGWLHDAPVARQAEKIMQAEIARIAHTHAVAYVVRSAPEAEQRAALATQMRADVVYVLDPGLDECMRRASQDGRPRGTHKAIRVWYQRFEASGIDQVPGMAPVETSRSW